MDERWRSVGRSLSRASYQRLGRLRLPFRGKKSNLAVGDEEVSHRRYARARSADRAVHAVGSRGRWLRWSVGRVELRIDTDRTGFGPGPPLVFEGVSEAEPEDEDHEADGADRKERVPRHPHPAQRLHETLAEE